ncbi:MAG TPA: GNAT family N-acetyltransferase [Gaiellaceae bacterium]|nr:GNAT family N-acetyltransferase [Gaiellaceae bacterium]
MIGTVIETERLILREPTLEDADGAAEMLADPEVMAWLGGRTVPAEDVPAVLEKWILRWDENGCGPFSVLRREDGRWIGRAGILVWDVRTWTHATFAGSGEFAQPELGWALASEHWGSGYATEAARAVREWAYSDLGVERLVSVIAPANVRSAKVAERLGATPGETVELFDNGPHVVWTHPR